MNGERRNLEDVCLGFVSIMKKNRTSKNIFSWLYSDFPSQLTMPLFSWLHLKLQLITLHQRDLFDCDCVKRITIRLESPFWLMVANKYSKQTNMKHRAIWGFHLNWRIMHVSNKIEFRMLRRKGLCEGLRQSDASREFPLPSSFNFRFKAKIPYSAKRQK